MANARAHATAHLHALPAAHVTGRCRAALTPVGLVAGVSGTLIGVFPMDFDGAHRIVSGVFFCTSLILAVVFSAWLATHRRSGWPHWLTAAGAVVIALLAIFMAVYHTYQPADTGAGVPERSALATAQLLEWAALVGLLGWFVGLSLVLIRRGSWPTAE